MPRNADKQARAEAMLGELAELGLMVARELAVRLRETEDAEEAVALAGAFQNASRAVRLTLALDAKLERDAAAEARETDKRRAEAEAQAAHDAHWRQVKEERAAAAAQPADPIEARKDRVRGLVNRLLWNESEGDEEDYEVLTEDLNARLDEAALSPDFEDLPIETLTRRLIADMDLPGRFELTLGGPRVAPRREPQPQLTDTG
jgi:hypothetical protein